LIPYAPSESEYFGAEDEILPPPEIPPFNTDIFHSSPKIWDDSFPDPSDSPSFIDEIFENLDPSPMKVANTETTFLSTLKIETPLTPVSTRSPQHLKNEGYAFFNTKLITPLTPSSPVDLHHFDAVLDETLSAETSLRQPVPQIPSATSRTSDFPQSMYAIFMAEDGLRCDGLARSILDATNDEMKWQPFLKPSRTIDQWPEDLEGEWECFVDYTGSNVEWDMVVLSRKCPKESDQLLEIATDGFGDDGLIDDFGDNEVVEEDGTELMGILDAVRKRKSLVDGVCHDTRMETDSKRRKSSQQSRIGEFMTLRGHEVNDLSDDETPGMMMLRKLRSVELIIVDTEDPDLSDTAPPPVSLTAVTKVTAPSPPFNPSDAVRAVILSTTSLHFHSLITFLHDTFTETKFVERDLTTPNELETEGDIILSPNRCISFFSLAQITQTLPSNASRKILAVAAKYRQVEVLVMSTGRMRGKDVASFAGWLESIRRDYDIRWIFVNGEEELERWVGWLCLQRDVDGEGHEIELLSEDVTTVRICCSMFRV
jgi:hypothetical protein